MIRRNANVETPSITDAEPDEPSRREAIVQGGALVAGIGAALATMALPRKARAQQSDVQTLRSLQSAEYAAIKAYTAGGAYLMTPSNSDPMASAALVVLAVADHFRAQHRD